METSFFCDPTYLNSLTTPYLPKPEHAQASAAQRLRPNRRYTHHAGPEVAELPYLSGGQRHEGIQGRGEEENCRGEEAQEEVRHNDGPDTLSILCLPGRVQDHDPAGNLLCVRKLRPHCFPW